MWPFPPRPRADPVEVKELKRHLWPLSIWRPQGDLTLEGSEAIFGAVTLLSNSLSSMRLHLYQGHEIAHDHPLERLIAYQPSPTLDAYTWRQTMEVCRDTAGNAYALKVRGGDGSIRSLDILDPGKVEAKRAIETGDLWYEILKPEGGSFLVSAQEMIHVRHVSSGGINGVSPIKVLRDTLDYDAQMKTFSIEQAKGINGAIVLEVPANVGETQRNAVIDSFMAEYTRSSGSLLVLGGGIKATSINRSPIDAKVLDVDRITANKVARVYNIPPMLLGDYGTRSGSHEDQQMEYLERTIIPIVRMYEAQLDRKLLTWEDARKGYHFHFETSDLVTADQQSRSVMYQNMVRSGIATPNEMRRREGLPDLDGGDQLYASRDLAPLSWLQANPGKE